MQADIGGAQDADDNHPTPYFGFTDLIFVVVAIIVAVLVLRLGYMTWSAGSKTETTKENGEAVATWMTEKGLKREANEDTGIPACNRGTSTWGQCRDALVAAEQIGAIDQTADGIE